VIDTSFEDNPRDDEDDQSEGAVVGLSRSERIVAGALYVVLGLAIVMIVWSFSHPTLALLPFGIGAAGFALAVIGLVLCNAIRVPGIRRGRPVLVAGIAIVLLIAVHATDAPLRLRWAVSEPMFARVVAALPPPDRPVQRWLAVPSQIGLYSIDQAEADAGGYLFFDAQGGDLADLGAGFAYLPHGIPADPGQYRFRHLDGLWYTFVGDS
jgi:hypothetical protein